MTCIADDITECDCVICTGANLEWEHWQGWHADTDEDGCPECGDHDDEE